MILAIGRISKIDEQLHGIVEVRGSIPLGSTNNSKDLVVILQVIQRRDVRPAITQQAHCSLWTDCSLAAFVVYRTSSDVKRAEPLVRRHSADHSAGKLPSL